MNFVTATTFSKSQISEIWLKKATLATLLIPFLQYCSGNPEQWVTESRHSVRPEVDLVLHEKTKKVNEFCNDIFKKPDFWNLA